MIDVQDTLRSELHRLVPIERRPDWEDVIAQSGLRQERARRRLAVAAAVVAVAAVVGVATPLGAAIARGVDDFSSWLTGQPGSPVSEQEQRAFERANAKSWLGFPQGTRLRRLITRRASGASVELFGFRSGTSTLCLRLSVVGKSRTSTLKCAPLAELRRADGPVRVVIVDRAVGKGKKVAWYGIDRLHSANLQITAGIAADGVRSVVLEDDAGRHEVVAASNAFLYVAEQPEVGQRVKRIWARTTAGLMSVPFVPVPFGFAGVRPAGAPAAAPPVVERKLAGGKIGWLEAGEPRGEPLGVLPPRLRSVALGKIPRRSGLRINASTNVVFGRLITPDPDRPLRVVISLNAHRPGGPVAGLCKWMVSRGGIGGGCSPYPGVFDRSPVAFGMAGGSAFVTIDGVASDDVGRLRALLADGRSVKVALNNNVFIVDLPRASLPVRLVAYDRAGRVISVSDPLEDFGRGPGAARGRAASLLRVSGPDGVRAELFVGRSTGGGECMYIRHFLDRQHRGVLVSCKGRAWQGPPLQLSAQFLPPRVIGGRVRSDIKTVRLRFADGSSAVLRPSRGYVLYAAPLKHLRAETAVASAEGLRADGSVVGRTRFNRTR